MKECKKTAAGKRPPRVDQSIYVLGILGAAVYYLTHANGFWMGAIGLLKAVFWPAVLVYKLFEHFSL